MDIVPDIVSDFKCKAKITWKKTVTLRRYSVRVLALSSQTFSSLSKEYLSSTTIKIKVYPQ